MPITPTELLESPDFTVVSTIPVTTETKLRESPYFTVVSTIPVTTETKLRESPDFTVVTTIENDLIPDSSRVVFDWDNTLKIYDHLEKKTISRVDKEFLERLLKEKKCELFIISAIRPSQLNIETLLIEVKRLGLLDYFCSPDQRTVFGSRKEVRGNYHWVQEGNIIICGYDKAEVFKSIVSEVRHEDVSAKTNILFDDEIDNVVNFNAIVEESLCYHMKNL